MEIKINLAGQILRISGADGEMFPEPGILAPYVCEAARVDRDIVCRIVDRLPEPAGVCLYHDASRWVYQSGDAVVSYMGAVERSVEDAYIRAEHRERTTDLQVLSSSLNGRIPAKTVINGLEAEHWITQNDGFLFHCSYISHEGGAILFTAPSGVGKSTQAELWRLHRGARIINGDRAVVRLGQQGIEAWGVPFCGSSGISNRSCLPLRAVVCLSQAPKTTIRPLIGARAFRLLWEGCSVHTWNRSDVLRCSETVQRTVEQVPVFHLACTPDESAVLALEQALTGIQR